MLRKCVLAMVALVICSGLALGDEVKGKIKKVDTDKRVITITIGENSQLQDGCVLHVDPGFPVTIGKNVRCTTKIAQAKKSHTANSRAASPRRRRQRNTRHTEKTARAMIRVSVDW